MAKIKLLPLLHDNKSLLGNGYEKIGKTSGKGCLGRKILLSYNDKKGWSLVKLNPFQLFFRNVFGAYKNTHLKHVFTHLTKGRSKNEVREAKFYPHIAEIWAKRSWKAVGNAPINKAQVFCFGEKHGDKAHMAAVIQFINGHYKPGDVVLTEASELGTVKEKNQLVTGLKKECVVQGWEPENVQELLKEAFATHDTKYQQLHDIFNNFEKNFPKGSPPSQVDFSKLENHLNKIADQIFLLNKYFRSNAKIVVESKKALSHILQGCKSARDPHETILYVLTKIITKLENRQGEALYANMTPEQAKILFDVAPKRDIKLINEISKLTQDAKRVFVIGGLAHFLQIPNTYNSLPVRQELKKHNYIIFTRKEEFSQKIARLNPGALTQKTYPIATC